MGRIHVLDSALADQIAAGEVVERPASVVKELVENALDAGATNVQVEIDDEGVGRIEIRDDGAGMDADDAVLAVQRHATSKLRRFADLLELATLGFRGEALASIASVSKLELRTRTKDVDVGTCVRVEGGAAAEVRPIGCPVGTTVRVEDLFFNVPARRKFLKSQATENARVTQVLRRVGLANPGLRLRLVRDGRVALELLPASDLAHRLKQIFPKDRFVTMDGEERGVRVRAWLGQAAAAQSGAGHLHLFVNRRPVQDAKIAKAIAYAYGDALPSGKYPSGVVFLELAPSSVDVNVHPQKAEVRFADEEVVMRAVDAVVSRALVREEQTRFIASRPQPPPDSVPTRGTGFWNDRLGLGPLKHGQKLGTATVFQQGREPLGREESPRRRDSASRAVEPAALRAESDENAVDASVETRSTESTETQMKFDAPSSPSVPYAPEVPAPDAAVCEPVPPAIEPQPRATTRSKAPSERSDARTRSRRENVADPTTSREGATLEARIAALVARDDARARLEEELIALVRAELREAVDALELAATELEAARLPSAARVAELAARLRGKNRV
jgi:DNA mismatch repair protein MutL